MIGLYKRNTAKVFPNAIEVVTLQHRYFFSSFMFRDAAFRLASQAWSDYLEASPSNETHRINSNSKMDLELFFKKSAGDEQVKMIEELDDESIESSHGSSPPTESSTLGSKKLGDSNGRSNATASTPSGSMSNLPEKWDNSEDSPAVDETDKKKKRKSIAVSKKSRAESASSANGKDMDDSEETTRHKSIDSASSPPQSRHSKNTSDAGSKARNVGFDLRMPASNGNGDVSSEKLADADVPSSAAESLSGNGASSKEGASANGASTPPPDGGASGESGAGGGGGGGNLPDIPVKIPTQASCKHIIEEAEDKKFSGTKLGNKTYKGVTLQQFFALVFCNTDYNKELVSHFDYQDWNAPTWALSDTSCCASRMVTYRMHLNASLGPKSTRVDSYQNARFKDDKTLLIESCNISKDVPMGDAFEVHEKWVITQEGKDVQVDLTAGVVWKKSAWGLKGTINQKSIEGVTDNWEFVQKHIDATCQKFVSGGGGGGGGGASASASSPPSRKKKVEDDDSSSDSEDKKPRRKRRSSRAKGAHPASSENSDLSASSDKAEGGMMDMLTGWKGIALIAISVLLILTCGYFAYNVSSISSRLQAMETNRHWAPSGHEENNLRERVAFLEHLTTALLRNVSEPGSYKSDQQRYFTALRDMDGFLGKAKESVATLQSSVHRLHEQKGEPLTTAQLVEALKTLPIDRKVLGYLTNPETFAQQLASVLETSPSTATYAFANTSNDSYGWYFYFFIASLLVAVAAAGGAKVLGVF